MTMYLNFRNVLTDFQAISKINTSECKYAFLAKMKILATFE